MITIAPGTICFVLGISLLLLGMKNIGVKTFFAVPEIISDAKGSGLVAKGLFAHVRHPIYLAESLMVLGAFLITSELSLIILLVAWIVIIWPVTFLEEKELSNRFGEEYKIYQNRVPRLLPKIRLKGNEKEI
ncbi:methyltransferase family protein [Candidatus Omnitrophota bacterium]